MAHSFRVTLAQLNPTVGDITGNIAKALSAWEMGKGEGADFVVLPEMFATGYQVQDLVLKPAFVADVMGAIEHLASQTTNGPALGIGGPLQNADGLFNAYYILQNGKITNTVKKHNLPNSTVFDEKRLFDTADISGPYAIGPIRIGTPICEDAWHMDVAEAQVESGADILIVPNGSPYERGKMDHRLSHVAARVIETGVPVIYLNMVGGQDDQIFDGGSFVLNPGGAMAASLPMFAETTQTLEFTDTPQGWHCTPGPKASWPDEWE